MNFSIESQIMQKISAFEALQNDLKTIESNLFTTQNQMDAITLEQDLIERGVVALTACKPLLAASSIKQCEDLANSAISSIFGFPYKVEWDGESQRFLLNKGEYSTDLADSEGGGITTVVSTVFTIYLLMKLGKRRFLAFDEAFTQISDQYFPNFLEFIREMCHDLNIDLLLISHDARITVNDADTAYRIENGHAIKLK